MAIDRSHLREDKPLTEEEIAAIFANQKAIAGTPMVFGPDIADIVEKKKTDSKGVTSEVTQNLTDGSSVLVKEFKPMNRAAAANSTASNNLGDRPGIDSEARESIKNIGGDSVFVSHPLSEEGFKLVAEDLRKKGFAEAAANSTTSNELGGRVDLNRHNEKLADNISVFEGTDLIPRNFKAAAENKVVDNTLGGRGVDSGSALTDAAWSEVAPAGDKTHLKDKKKIVDAEWALDQFGLDVSPHTPEDATNVGSNVNAQEFV